MRVHLNNRGESYRRDGAHSNSGVDLTQVIEKARESVTGKSAQNALLAFANLHRGVNAEELRNSALERMRQHPLQSLFAVTVMSRDGRVIAKRPAMGLGGELTEDDEIAIRAEMIRDYGILVSMWFKPTSGQPLKYFCLSIVCARAILSS